MVYKTFKDIELSRLGMGNMRLPANKDKSKQGDIDWEESQKMIDLCIEKGINYFDTAHVYNNTESESCVGHCLKKHDRSKFYIATKFNIGACKDYKAMFEAQLERLQTDYIDFYLIHCILDGNVDEYINSGAVDYFIEQKAQGRIKYLGFSSHASVATLERFADHHDWDFAQIQLNYFDWKFSSTAKEYEVLASRNIPIMVMEPVRGGRLAELTPECTDLLKAAHPDWSVPSWALRFVKSLPAAQVILSGMSNMEQLEDNLNTFSVDGEFTEADRDLIFEVADKFKNQVQVPCTSCRYCTDGCPMQINIPEFLKLYNSYKVDGRGALGRYNRIESEGKPTDCIGCGACTGHCPQGIDTPSIMQKLAELVS